MKPTDLSVAQLERIIPLLKEKESLQTQLDKVNAALSRLENGRTATTKSEAAPIAPKTTNRRSRRRGGLRAAVLKVLETADAKGMSVKELASKAKVNRGSLNTWLYTSGKKISGLKKLSPGMFVYKP
jgi:hypothetical protein